MMKNTMSLRLVTPQAEQVIEEITGLVTRVSDGSIGILPGHAPLLAETDGSEIICRLNNGEESHVSPGPAILQVERNRVTVFATGTALDDVRMPQRLLSEVMLRNSSKVLPENDER